MGRSFPQYILDNFTQLEKVPTKGNCHFWKCNYCNADPLPSNVRLQNRDNDCANHLVDHIKCPNAPREARTAAHLYMQSKKQPATVEATSGANTESAGAGSLDPANGAIVPTKKRKTQSTLDGIVDYPLSQAQKSTADLKLFRFLVHSSTSFNSVESPFFKDWIHDLRPSYDPPSRYVLSHDILDSEASRVHLLDVEHLAKMGRLLTVVTDGWEDILRRSIYGTAGIGVGQFPIVMSLDDLTGQRGQADVIYATVRHAMKTVGIEEGKCVIAFVTDNPTVMRTVRKKFEDDFPWAITLACFLHQFNTVVGEICNYAAAKAVLGQANRVVTFFNGSHYWGGQMKSEAARVSAKWTLKKNCESRWYAIILLAISVNVHQAPLSTTCVRPDART